MEEYMFNTYQWLKFRKLVNPKGDCFFINGDYKGCHCRTFLGIFNRNSSFDIDPGLVQESGISSGLAVEIQRSCTKQMSFSLVRHLSCPKYWLVIIKI